MSSYTSDSINKVLDTVVKALLFAYGCGYFIRVLFEAEYGFTNPNPFHYSVALAGIAFFFYLGLVVVILRADQSQFPLTSRLRLLREEANSSVPSSKMALLYLAAMWTSFLFEASLVATLLGSLLSAVIPQAVKAPPFRLFLRHTALRYGLLSSRSSKLVELLIALFLIYALARISVGRLNRTSAWLSIVTSIGMVTLLVARGGLAVRLFFWILLIRLAVSMFNELPTRQNWDYRLSFAVVCIGILLLYSKGMYGLIAAQYGGAFQEETIFRFDRQVYPFPDTTGSGFIIDEDSEGLYILPATGYQSHPSSVYVPKKDLRSMTLVIP